MDKGKDLAKDAVEFSENAIAKAKDALTNNDE